MLHHVPVCVPVNAGERAVMFNRLVGVKNVVVDEGTHFRVPWFDRPIVYDVRTRPHTIKSLTGSKGACQAPVPAPSYPSPHPHPSPPRVWCPRHQTCRWWRSRCVC